jgi:hypothetical protein
MTGQPGAVQRLPLSALDGRLEVESEVACGTTVRALIPCG